MNGRERTGELKTVFQPRDDPASFSLFLFFLFACKTRSNHEKKKKRRTKKKEDERPLKSA